MGVKRTIGHKYTRFMPYIWRQWSALVIILLLTVIGAAVTTLMPWPLKILIDYAISDLGLPYPADKVREYLSIQPTPVFLVFMASIASLGLFVLNSVLDVVTTWYWSATSQRMVYDLAADIFSRLQRLSLLFHNKRTVGDSLGRMTVDNWCVFSITQGLLMTPASNLFTLLMIGTVAWQMDPQLTVLSLVISPPLAASAVYFGNRLRQRAQKNREAQSSVMAFVHQTLTALPVVQAFGSERRNRRHYRQLSSRAVSSSQSSVLMRNSFTLVNGLTITTGAAIVLYVGGLRVISGALTLGSLLVFVAYMKTLQGAIESLLKTWGNLKAAEASMDRVLEILDADEEIRDVPGALVLPIHVAGNSGCISLEGVSFGYEPGRAVLHDINLDVEPGETIALVGPTGAGKSTLVSLIPRFFDPSQGRVMLDGRDLRDLQLTSLRKQISMVLQDPFLLPLTVAENIAYGRPDASREEVVAAAVAANADEFIQELSDGYDTPLAERGSTLSGGQKQRLSIARTFLKDAPILILDEPTSALDIQTEALLLEALKRLTRGRTTFMIAHRMSTIRDADSIVMIDNGRVVETGTHSELITANRLYAQFYALQNPDSQGVVA
jgi:ATP-binding cassette subfamily B protein/subfamily B ATP-binding cassette protein MsbA